MDKNLRIIDKYFFNDSIQNRAHIDAARCCWNQKLRFRFIVRFSPLFFMYFDSTRMRIIQSQKASKHLKTC